MTPNMYMHVFSVSVYNPLCLTTNTKKSRFFSDACVKYKHRVVQKNTILR